MKRTLCITLILCTGLLFILSATYAEFTLPYYVYRIDELEQAQEEARVSDSVIAFVYTNENTNCGLATAASLDVIQGLRDDSVIVYATSKRDADAWAKIPKIVRRAINSPQAGKYIPITVIVDSEIERLICIVPYSRDANNRKNLLREARDIISAN
jgi:hypothetical protein